MRCDGCRAELGTVTAHGCLRVRPGVAVYARLSEGFAVVTCPACGARRYWRGGDVEIGGAGHEKAAPTGE